jgi:hypothetical protein
MSRKPKKGYYVRGEFVAEGSELDLELKRELKGTSEASRTELKRESTELQKLGEELLTLRADLMNGLDVPEKLRDALADARRITNFEGKTAPDAVRRQADAPARTRHPGGRARRPAGATPGLGPADAGPAPGRTMARPPDRRGRCLRRLGAAVLRAPTPSSCAH